MAYSIGVDYGTGSGRVVLLNLDEATEVAVAVIPYGHGVIDTIFPTTGEKLPPDWALQHPMDYLDVLHRGIPAVLAETGVSPRDVIGIGIDFTSCTVLPVTQTGEPLCTMVEWAEHPHAWPKLWKHHAAQPIADRMNDLARERNEDFLTRYGGRISSEWYFPKLIEVFEDDPDVYQACDAFVEATDWIVLPDRKSSPKFVYGRLQSTLVRGRRIALQGLLSSRKRGLRSSVGKARGRILPAWN
ncbi:hypothetical protein GCM10025859_56640 [Alicyclobacillus fastidiosus]|nr:hypothetical protein GCM10025859_56640 [Alicyclobacillus fastidiosus]